MNLQSHNLIIDDADQEDQQADVEELNHHKYSIRVTQSPGYFCKITGTASFDLPPDKLWQQCIVHPDNQGIYRHMDKCIYRKVIVTTDIDNNNTDDTTTTQDQEQQSTPPPPPPSSPPLHTTSDNQHTRRIEVAHEASWRFLFWTGKFTTRLLVEEDHDQRIMRFSLLPGQSMLRKFDGTWSVLPDIHNDKGSISVLEQDIALGVWLPPPIDIILKKISAGQVKKIFDDIEVEVKKINEGRPTLCPYEQVKDKEIELS